MLGIETVTNAIKNAFETTMREPAKIIPGIIMLCSLAKRPGLSALVSFANITQELSNNGIPTDPLPDGSPNLMLKFLYATVNEVYRALKEDANIQIVTPPGATKVMVSGGNAGGPFVAYGQNVTLATGQGVLQ